MLLLLYIQVLLFHAELLFEARSGAASSVIGSVRFCSIRSVPAGSPLFKNKGILQRDTRYLFWRAARVQRKRRSEISPFFSIALPFLLSHDVCVEPTLVLLLYLYLYSL